MVLLRKKYLPLLTETVLSPGGYGMIYIEKVINDRPEAERSEYPYSIPVIKELYELEFRKSVTFITGENGTGKSTLIEAIAISAGFNPEGGSIYMNYSTYDTHSSLYNDIRLVRAARRNRDGYFLRAESFYNVASETDRISDRNQLARNYGGSLHGRSHGEGFLALAMNRMNGNGLYILDEPESALSVTSQLQFLVKMKELVDNKSQFIIATHSPILLAYPDADIYVITDKGLTLSEYEETEQYRLTKYFISNYRKVIAGLMNDRPDHCP